MRLSRAIFAVVLALLWVPVTNSCAIAAAFPEWFAPACECGQKHHEDALPCGGDAGDCAPCATLESGVNLAALAPVAVPQPAWVESNGLAELLRKLAQLETDSLAETPPLPPAIPPPPWREDLKMAQPVRGPSLAV